LHASLQLDALRECCSLGEVRRVIAAFPSSIEAVYLHTWHRIIQRNPTRIKLAKSVLLWVLYAARPMTLEELERAVATCPETYEFQPDEVVAGMNLVALCCGLVTFEEESGLVRLVRKSIRCLISYPMLTNIRLYGKRNAPTTPS
jgi:ankyrin repeat domain-containing protein 50